MYAGYNIGLTLRASKLWLDLAWPGGMDSHICVTYIRKELSTHDPSPLVMMKPFHQSNFWRMHRLSTRHP